MTDESDVAPPGGGSDRSNLTRELLVWEAQASRRRQRRSRYVPGPHKQRPARQRLPDRDGPLPLQISDQIRQSGQPRLTSFAQLLRPPANERLQRNPRPGMARSCLGRREGW